MTIICYRDSVMAADSMLTGPNDSYFADCVKIKKIKGWLIGAAGDFGPTELFMTKFDPSIIEEKRIVPWGGQSKEDDLNALIVSPKQKIYYMETNGAYALVKAKYIAIGSGEPVAMGAMEAGASAIDACKAAIRHCEGCGGRVRVLRLGKK